MSDRALIGIDIGGTKIAAAAIAPAGHILGRAQAATAAQASYDAFLATLMALVGEALSAAGTGPAGIGIGCSGPVDPARGTVHNPYTLPIPDGSDLVGPLRRRFGVPVALENDADAAALGEQWLGAGAGRELLVFVSIGTGVGVGIVRRGQIVRGAKGAHPEAGHLVVDMGGPACYCGAPGCWEALASGPAIGQAGQEAAREGLAPGLLALVGGQAEAVNAEAVFAAAQAGEEAAARIVARAAQATAAGVTNLVHCLAPDAVILGGGVMRHYELFQPAIGQALAGVVMVPTEGLLVAPARLGQDAGALGAARAVALAMAGSSLA